jgi:hypothetical protein
MALNQLAEVPEESPAGTALADALHLTSGPKIIHKGQVCQVSLNGEGLCPGGVVVKYGQDRPGAPK